MLPLTHKQQGESPKGEREMKEFIGPKELSVSWFKLKKEATGRWPSQKDCDEWAAMAREEQIEWCRFLAECAEFYVPWGHGNNLAWLPEYAHD
jgi:hypothetical protein